MVEGAPAVSEPAECDICVIGAGSGGLLVAAGASQLGVATVLIERAHMGGDCLNFGCVPSKALLAAGKAAAAARHAGRFGVDASPRIDFHRTHDHVHGVIAAIAPQDSVARYTGFGVRVIQAHARFTGPTEVTAGDVTIRARRVVVATGSSPLVPPIPGLKDVPYFTNETVFANAERPGHLLVIGGGPIGVELAQAHRNLGSEVTVVEMARVLPKDDPELVPTVTRRLQQDGIRLIEGAKVTAVGGAAGAITLSIERDGKNETLTGTHLLLAAGRKANVDDLGLDRAGIAYSPKGVQVDARLRTTNKKVFAVGDVAGGLQFTHLAGYHAGIVIRNALFRLPAKADHRFVPWVTYTEPELAQVGLTESEAKARHGRVQVLRHPFAENDRAQAERELEGMIKIVLDGRSRIVGCGIVGPHAGELILPWVLALNQRLKLSAMASAIVPYPTFSEVSKRVAGSYYTPKLFTERTRKIVRFLTRFG
jgi:pyruvate/2-oxoglutarate dehydrogenase complex dihydrolipoamide dehydrogenase (E3) component